MGSSDFPVSLPPSSRLLSSADFHRLADVPLVVEWFANIDSGQTWRAYGNALEDFNVLRMATVDGAKLLNMFDRIGSLTPGKRANLIIINPRSVNFARVLTGSVKLSSTLGQLMSSGYLSTTAL